MWKYVLIIYVLLPFSVYAAPTVSSISGTVSHGNSITISGSSFGTKSTAAPLKWETFEDGTVGQDVDTTGYWSMRSIKIAEFNNTYLRHSNSTKNIKWEKDYDTASGPKDFYRDSLNFNGTVYLNLWVQLGPEFEGDYQWQHKVFFIQGGANYADQPYSAFLTHYGCEHNCEAAQYPTETYINVFQIYGQTSEWMNDQKDMNKWFNVTVGIKENDIGSSNAEFWCAVSATDGVTAYDTNTKDSFSILTDIDDRLRTITLGHITVNLSPDDPEPDDGIDGAHTVTYWDDIYIDNSWARVEIGDNATYANCTHREIQIPTAWSTTSATVTVNTGSLSNGTAYLFVVDSDNAASSGYEITIGSGSMTHGTGTITHGTGSMSGG